jgi:triphosphoribosyl-dephospho-CoA synthase
MVTMPSIGQLAALACIWEATARKPGNVHRYRDFADVTLIDFLTSALALAPVLDQAEGRPIGETVLTAVQATRRLVAANTNLGIILLLAPLATVRTGDDLRAGVEDVLGCLTVNDSRAVYQAIRLAQPGGLDSVPEQDIRTEPTLPLRDIMALAAGRDLIARQYVNGFQEVFGEGIPALLQGLEKTGCLENAIIYTHLNFMSRHPDSLIARKRGLGEAEEASRLARGVLEAGWPHSALGHQAIAQLDTWLQEQGHERNPGTSADLVTASLFAALRQGIMKVPSPWPWQQE